MQSKLKWVIIAAAAVVLFVGVYFLYDNLKDKYAPDQFSDFQTNEQDESDEPSVTSDDSSQEDEIDYSAPDFTVLDPDENSVKLSDYFGRPIVLNFWASWCYYCKEEMPDFNQAYLDNSDIQFMMVNVTDGSQETLSSAKKFIEDSEFEFPVFYDTELDAAITYGASGLPMTVFINKDGELVTYARGLLSAENLQKGIELIKD